MYSVCVCVCVQGCMQLQACGQTNTCMAREIQLEIRTNM